MSGPTVEVVERATLNRLAMNQVEEEAASFARAVMCAFAKSPACDCERCAVVRQARVLLRLLGKE